MKKKNEGRAVPIEIKRDRGTANVTRERRKKEPEYPSKRAAEIRMPPSFLKTDGAKEVWYLSLGQLAGAGLLFDSCYPMVEAYCRAYDVMQGARDAMDENGMMIGDRANPACKIYNDAFDQLYRIALQMGFTPVSKTKINSGALEKIGDKNKQKKIGVTG